RRGVQFSALVIRADDENAHVAPVRRGDGGPVQVVDEIPVNVQVIEFTAVHHLEDDVRGRVRGETDVADETIQLQPARGGQTAVLLQRPFQELPVIDAVQGEQVHVCESQILQGLLEGL